jgi:hypothetical protein
VVAAASLLLSGQAFFAFDDWVVIDLVYRRPFPGELLLRPWWDHLMPGMVVSTWLLYRLFGLAWPAVMVVMALAATALAGAMITLADTAFGRGRASVAVGVAGALSFPVLSQSLWFQATLNPVIPVMAGLWMLACASRWAQPRSTASRPPREPIRAQSRAPGWLLGAAGAYAVALNFVETSLLFAPLAVLWSVLVLDRDLDWRRRWRSFWGRWPLWAMLAGLSLIHLYFYLGGEFGAEAAGLDLGGTAQFLLHGIVLGALPSWFGLTLDLPPWSAWAGWVVGGAITVALAALAWLTCRTPQGESGGRFRQADRDRPTLVNGGQVRQASRADGGREAPGDGPAGRSPGAGRTGSAGRVPGGRRAARGLWAFLGLTLLLELAPVALGRAGVMGLAAAQNQRYLLVATTLGLLGLLGLWRQFSWPPTGRRAVGLVVVLGCLAWASALGCSLVPQLANPEPEIGAPRDKYSGSLNARKWIEQLDQTWPGDDVAWVDVRYHQGWFVSAADAWYPYNLSSAILGTLRPWLTWTTDPAGAYFVDETGRAAPVALERRQPQDLALCLAPGRPLRLDLSPTADQLVFDYTADQAGELATQAELASGTVEEADGLPGGPAIALGQHSLLLRLRHPEQVVAVTITATAPLCLSQVASAEIVPG